MRDQELLPCPFCGGKAIAFPCAGKYYVKCVPCQVEIVRDTREQAAAEWNRRAPQKDARENNPGNISDGYHTFNELYHHRAVLFSLICNQNKDIAWKSLKHEDGSMYKGMFIVGINTPYGQATYHIDRIYWLLFKVKKLDTAPKWDGHTPAQAAERIRQMSKREENKEEPDANQ